MSIVAKMVATIKARAGFSEGRFLGSLRLTQILRLWRIQERENSMNNTMVNVTFTTKLGTWTIYGVI